jgi:hypothetical protein
MIDEIKNLINLKSEGAYWDFKEKWHSNKAVLLHDIICMANNLEDRDAYLIIGVCNDGNVKGVPEEDRKTQQQLIDFLKDKRFAGGVRPITYVESLNIEGVVVDVVIVKNTLNTPYYLTDDFQSLSKGNIYTRVCDTNTPKNMTADIDKVEWLWRKRFGMVGSFESKVKRILQIDGWLSVEDVLGEKYYFNEHYPEMSVKIDVLEVAKQRERCTAHDSFFYLYANIMFWSLRGEEKLTRKCYNILWHGNPMYRIFTIRAPKMDFDFVEPKIDFLNGDIGIMLFNGFGLGAQYAYFIEDSVEYMLLKKIFPLQASDAVISKYNYRPSASNLGMGVIPIFANKKEYSDFMSYIVENKESFKSEYEEMNVDDDMFSGAQAKKDERIKQSFRLGKLLVKWLEEWLAS